MIQREVKVEVDSLFRTTGLMSELYGSRTLIGTGHSTVSEPAEWIRQVELARTYWPMIRQTLSIDKTDSIIDDFRKRPDHIDQAELSFRTHNEARAYLQKIVNGGLSRRDTDAVGEWRLIDALDRNGIAHQAYFGMKQWNRDMEEQLLKDAEILSKGQVNGVVWHFFKREHDQSVGLSNKLRNQLETRGIIIVVHE